MKSKKQKKEKVRDIEYVTDPVADALSCLNGPLTSLQLVRLIVWSTVMSGFSRDWEAISKEVGPVLERVNLVYDEMKSSMH